MLLPLRVLLQALQQHLPVRHRHAMQHTRRCRHRRHHTRPPGTWRADTLLLPLLPDPCGLLQPLQHCLPVLLHLLLLRPSLLLWRRLLRLLRPPASAPAPACARAPPMTPRQVVIWVTVGRFRMLACCVLCVCCILFKMCILDLGGGVVPSHQRLPSQPTRRQYGRGGLGCGRGGSW